MGSLTASYQISSSIKPVSSLKISGIKNKPYTGEEILQDLIVKDGKNTLLLDRDYVLFYENNTNAGTAYLVLEGVGDYFGSLTKSFKITPLALSLKNTTIEGLPGTIDYCGDFKPYTELYYNGSYLEEGIDYTVTYKNTNKAGKATITYKGIGNYSGSINASYTIKKLSLEDNTSIDMEYYQNYAKGGVKPIPQISSWFEDLIPNTNFTLTYKNNTRRGMATVTIKGKGNYEGTITRNFYIRQQYLYNLDLYVADKAYSEKKGGWKSVPVLTDLDGKKLVAGTDYNKNIGYYYVTDTLVTDGSSKQKSLVMRYAGETVRDADILPAGTEVKVVITPLQRYGVIKRVTGNAYVKIAENYEGSVETTYQIVEYDISKATVSIPVQYFIGKPIVISKKDITVKVGNTVLGSDDYSYDIWMIQNNINPGKATFTIYGQGNYGGSKVVNFTIKKRALGITILFERNGATSGNMNDLVIYKNTKIPNCSYKKIVGGRTYTFKGWAETRNGPVKYKAGDIYNYSLFKAGSIVSLYAVWE